jgi:hypothetical protein
MQIAPIAGSCDGEVRCNKAACAGELPFPRLYPPTCRPCDHTGFNDRRYVSVAGRRKLEDVPGAIAECDLTGFVKLVGAGEPQFRLEEGEFAIGVGQICSYT